MTKSEDHHKAQPGPALVIESGGSRHGGGAGRASEAMRRSRLWRSEIVVFIANACIMILELVAGRIIAPQVGVSLYTWTSVIGVILAGMSLGNYLGGRLADRYASLRLLGGVFLLGGITSLGILAADTLAIAARVEWPIIVEILVLIAVLFLPPAVVLGMISPIVVKLAVEDLARAGSTVGRISAAGTAGSILGTFVTGFWLIAWLGTHAVVLCVATLLLVVGLVLLVRGRRLRDATLAALVLLTPIGAVRAGWTRSQCLRETPYHLTTKEFNERVRAWLKGDGLYVVNIIDGALGRFLRAYVRTLQQTFEYVYVIPRLTDWRSVSRDTFVIVACSQPLSAEAFPPGSRFARGVLGPEVVEALLAEGDPIILTDRHAPVEQMLAPVFLEMVE